MIPRSDPRWQTADWQRELSQSVKEPAELFALLQLDGADPAAARLAAADFPLRVPRPFIARMRKGDWNDPLLRQVLPLGAELDHQPGYSVDPLAERDANPRPGLIHKYRGRVLLVVSGACAINCRYCFRRSFPYQDNNPGREQWGAALDYIAADDSIEEVIFSGGDPLAAPDQRLTELVQALAEIPHLKRLRVHTRLPVMIPARVTDGLLAALTGSRLPLVLVIHSNHAREFDAEVVAALARLRRTGATLLNQSVLLKGVNDDSDALCALSETLFSAGALPYYLHLLDRIQGAAHFDVPAAAARTLVAAMAARLPGYLVPKLVREQAGAPAKTPIHWPL